MENLPETIELDNRLAQLPEALADEGGFTEVVAALQAAEPATIDGAWGSACALAAAAIARHAPSLLVVVCPDQKRVDAFCDDIGVFTDQQIERLPAWESDPGERLVYDDIYGDRLRVLKSLLHRQYPRIVVTSIQSLLQPVPPRTAVVANTRQLQNGQSINVDDLADWLVSHGFHATSGVELPGEFARRGGLFDIFAPDWRQPVRIELFGDEVESLRPFDVVTQRSDGFLQTVEITMLPSSGNDAMRAAGEREHFTSYLPDDAWIGLVEPPQIDAAARQYIETYENVNELYRLSPTLARLAKFGHVAISSFVGGVSGTHCHLRTESVERFRGDIHHVRDELSRVADNQQVLLVCETDAEGERLREVFQDTLLHQQGRLCFPTGRLKTGFHWVSQGWIIVSGADLFGRHDPRRQARRRLGKRIDSFLDLREGDLVIHLSHGVGRYRGMDVLTRSNQVEEHLIVEFHGGTRLYVPVTKIDLVQKYVGGSKGRPKLAKLGSQSWVKSKKAAESAVTDMAAELLDLQAHRQARRGIRFRADTEWQRDFDASFAYEETDDQRFAAEAIKSDMQAARPMDRLLCGDVGFGKTEVAMRAVFKAVDNGYQVAVLVPTTILAEQHFHTFQQRMAEFPFEIAKLSRFCSAREQRITLEHLVDGTVDIVIGTHRLASRDVQFQNLGLLIIDEEQRFGVQVKERLKSLRTTIDVLTMTATPIPRTLHMSLTGLRDISNLETPPEDRIAVETRVSRWDNQLIRHAILREIGRGGQVFFVHNRVQDIELVRARLERIVPEATIRIGHGQMHEADLEQIMVDFVAGQFDVLLATTIVESGLDIPNANTIFIDEADHYGLADLHQLRGRVGRFKHRAYCYLLVPQHKPITAEASRRLRAIEEFSQMGAGFAIAMRDLEFRGAGNVLGTQQSGHIAAVGYELYCQLLEAAVRRLKKQRPKLEIDVNIDLPGRALIPDDYVPDRRMRIDLYRRLSRISSEEDLRAMSEELLDRFGPIPPALRRLLMLASLKLDAAIWQVAEIRTEEDYLVFEFRDAERIRQLAKLRSGKLRIVDAESAYWTLNDNQREPDSILRLAQTVLRPN